jgi:hypothetical protein
MAPIPDRRMDSIKWHPVSARREPKLIHKLKPKPRFRSNPKPTPRPRPNSRTKPKPKPKPNLGSGWGHSWQTCVLHYTEKQVRQLGFGQCHSSVAAVDLRVWFDHTIPGRKSYVSVMKRTWTMMNDENQARQVENSQPTRLRQKLEVSRSYLTQCILNQF